MKTIAVAGTFDSKSREFLFVKEQIEKLGLNTLTIHTGVFEPGFTPDIDNVRVAEAAGKSIDRLKDSKDRGEAMAVLSEGTRQLVSTLYQEGAFDGIISLGGSGGTSLVTPAMQALPIGVPKVMVSTMASGETSQYVGTSDIVMMPSVVDVAGLNAISMRIFSNAVHAVVGMVTNATELPESEKPLVAASMFGVTTPCVDKAKAYLEAEGYEVLVFHATGTGGKSMEALIEAGYFKGVLDVTTTEWCDELVGGVLTAGDKRLEAAGRTGVPQVVSVGAVDMVNFGPYDTIPKAFEGRLFYKHNPTVTLMRTTVEENRSVGSVIAEKLNSANGKTALLLPLKGVSLIDGIGQPFYGPEEDAALFETLRREIDADKVSLIEIDAAINDDAFALAAAKKLVELMRA
ncbi:Tm-1-like ATP-binding domain-containing protein [Fusibacter sp. JL298sf-3]